MIPDHTQRPDLCTAQPDLLFNLLEVAADSVENHPEATQYLRCARGIDGVLENGFHDAMNRKKKEPLRAPNSSS